MPPSYDRKKTTPVYTNRGIRFAVKFGGKGGSLPIPSDVKVYIPSSVAAIYRRACG